MSKPTSVCRWVENGEDLALILAEGEGIAIELLHLKAIDVGLIYCAVGGYREELAMGGQGPHPKHQQALHRPPHH